MATSSPGLSVSVDRFDIVKAKAESLLQGVLPAGVSGRQYVLYTLKVEIHTNAHRTDVHKVQVRYSDVQAMHDRLQQITSSDLRLPALPPKTTTRRFDGPFLQGRSQDLEEYFLELCHRPALVALAPVQRLLQLEAVTARVKREKAVARNAAAAVPLPVPVALVRTKNVVAFSYNSDDGTLLAATEGTTGGSADRDSSGRLASSLPMNSPPLALSNGRSSTSSHSSRAVSALTMWRARGGNKDSEQLWSVSLPSAINCVASDSTDVFAGLENGEIVHRKAGRHVATGTISETHQRLQTRGLQDMYLPNICATNSTGTTASSSSPSTATSSTNLLSNSPTPWHSRLCRRLTRTLSSQPCLSLRHSSGHTTPPLCPVCFPSRRQRPTGRHTSAQFRTVDLRVGGKGVSQHTNSAAR